MTDWYEENIEPGIRDVVKLLRDNGFNTECSCEHEMYVQCRYISDGEIDRLHHTLFNAGYRDYIIDLAFKVHDGHIYSTFDVRFPVDDDKADFFLQKYKRKPDMDYNI